MGTWGRGPFDNDDAADVLADLGSLTPPERAAVVTSLLAAPSPDYLEVDEGQTLVALAALVAASLGHPVDGADAVRELLDTGGIPTDPQTRRLAVAALQRVGGADSEWAELWDEAESLGTVLAINEALAHALRETRS